MAGKTLSRINPDIQQLRYQGEKVKFQGQLKGNNLQSANWMSSRLKISRRLTGGGIYYAARAGWTSCKWASTATLNLPQEPSLVDAELDWRKIAGN